MQCYNLVQAIEACGASPELTHAVLEAGKLGEEIEKMVDQRPWVKCECLKQNELRLVYEPTWKACPNCKGLGFYQN